MSGNPLKPRSERWAKVCAFYRVREGYWFAPKLYGYGATPVTWQGWAALVVLIGLMLAIASLAHENRVFLALLAPLVVSAVLLIRAKTDGDWRWRWGVEQ